MTLNLITATAEVFDAYIGEKFITQTQEGPVTLTLDNVKRYNPANKRDNTLEIEGVTYPPREPFGLTFVGPLSPALPQMLYSLKNEKTGPLDIFLSAFAQEAAATLYESSFN